MSRRPLIASTLSTLLLAGGFLPAALALDAADQEEALRWHRYVRCLHGRTNELLWDDQLARRAQEHADLGDRQFVLDGRGRHYHQNTAWAYVAMAGSQSRPMLTAAGAVMLWYYEIVRTPGCSGETETPPEPSFNKTVLHYAQLVWKDTRKVGCGKGKTTFPYEGVGLLQSDFWVCLYDTGPERGSLMPFGAKVSGVSRGSVQCHQPTDLLPDCVKQQIADLDRAGGMSLAAGAASSTAGPRHGQSSQADTGSGLVRREAPLRNEPSLDSSWSEEASEIAA
mmetsp:Transcript_5214/g.15018  ORF Transcript_5214/g.15018 Transcript_5214/m.15018 type:complete len:281 (-) Transcript_5214:29-871(-)